MIEEKYSFFYCMQQHKQLRDVRIGVFTVLFSSPILFWLGFLSGSTITEISIRRVSIRKLLCGAYRSCWKPY